MFEELLCEGSTLGVAAWVRGSKCDLTDKDILYVTQGVLVGQFMQDRARGEEEAAAAALEAGAAGEAGRAEAVRRRVDHLVRHRLAPATLSATLFPSTGWMKRTKVIIIDEAHERGFDTDVILGWCKRVLPYRPELRVVVCSATIRADDFASFFALTGQPCPVVHVRGRTFPVTIIHDGDGDGFGEEEQQQKQKQKQGDDQPSSVSLCVGLTDRILRRPANTAEKHGNIVVFLPGKEECDEARAKLEGLLALDAAASPPVAVMVLYGAMPLEDQLRATVQDDPLERRKVIFATNVAETSLTIEGVGIVVDSGQEKVLRYDHADKLEKLELVPTARSSCDQRAGRAGRTGPGLCFRVYSERSYAERAAHRDPAMLTEHLGSMLLKLCAIMGEDDPATFPFLSAPDAQAFEEAVKFLFDLGAVRPLLPQDQRDLVREAARDTLRSLDGLAAPPALDALVADLMDRYAITDLGKQISSLGVEPALGKLLILSMQRGCVREALDLSCMLSIRDPFYYSKDAAHESTNRRMAFAGPARTGDHLVLVRAYREYVENSVRRRDLGWAKRNGLMAQSMWQAHLLHDEFERKLREYRYLYSEAATEGYEDRQQWASAGPIDSPETWRVFCDTLLAASAVELAHHRKHNAADKAGRYITSSTPSVRADIHPRSILAGVDAPKIVYSKVHKTGKCFLHVVSLAPDPET